MMQQYHVVYGLEHAGQPDVAGSLVAHDREASCLWHPQSKDALATWDDYKYMTSIAFLTERPFIDMAPRYDMILRVDQDAFVTPHLLKWQPPHRIAFGHTGYTDDFTQKRLKEVAARLKLVHRGVHNFCSGWFVPPQDAINIANLTLAIGRHFLQNEYGQHLPGLEQWPDQGSWPSWWRGVTSLYSAELAINHLFENISESNRAAEIDEPSLSESSIDNHVHIHCLHNMEKFAKFEFREQLELFKGASLKEKQANASKAEPITPNMPVNRYASAIAWRSVYTSATSLSL